MPAMSATRGAMLNVMFMRELPCFFIPSVNCLRVDRALSNATRTIETASSHSAPLFATAGLCASAYRQCGEVNLTSPYARQP